MTKQKHLTSGRLVGLLIAAMSLWLSSCDTKKPSTVQIEPKEDSRTEQEFQITLGGFIKDHPEEGTLGGMCKLTDYTRTQMSCDLYNGLSNLRITEATIIVAWAPYGDGDKRLFRLPVNIPPLNTAQVNFKLGTKLPNDDIVRGERIGHWGWTYGPI